MCVADKYSHLLRRIPFVRHPAVTANSWLPRRCRLSREEPGWIGVLSRQTTSYPKSADGFCAGISGYCDYAVSLRSESRRTIQERACAMETGGNDEPLGGRGVEKKQVQYGFAKLKSPKRQSIQDFHVACIKEVGEREIGLFAVMDGHAGPDVAIYLTENLYEVITMHPDFTKDPQKAIIEAYHETDNRILGMGDNDVNFREGSTATTALLLDGGQRLIVAHVGDSRAVLCRAGEAVDLTVDHEPQKPEEREMVESKGGIVTKSLLSQVYRVDNRLAMSRAFGDYDLKSHLSVHPDIWDEQLTPGDRFFVIASDGVWHVMSSQEVVDCIGSTPGTAEQVAQAVVAAALLRHSKDDISCLVVFL